MKAFKQRKASYLSRGVLLTMLLISGVLLYAQSNNKNNKDLKNEEVKMSSIERNKAAIRKLYEQCLNKRNMELLQELISDEYIGIDGTKGVAGFKAPILVLIKAFPDAAWSIDELIGEGDKVMVKQKFQGTQAAQFQYIASTGKTASNEGVAIYEFKDGKVIRTKVLTDRLGFLQQLEVLPPDLATLSNTKIHKDQVNFIDKFFVPAAAKKEFYDRMQANRNLIKTLPGFIEDAAYQYTDKDGNLICVTVALWENMEALGKAKEAVQAEYKKQGFDAAAMMKRLNIVADRGIYTKLAD